MQRRRPPAVRQYPKKSALIVCRRLKGFYLSNWAPPGDNGSRQPDSLMQAAVCQRSGTSPAAAGPPAAQGRIAAHHKCSRTGSGRQPRLAAQGQEGAAAAAAATAAAEQSSGSRRQLLLAAGLLAAAPALSLPAVAEEASSSASSSSSSAGARQVNTAPCFSPLSACGSSISWAGAAPTLACLPALLCSAGVFRHLCGPQAAWPLYRRGAQAHGPCMQLQLPRWTSAPLCSPICLPKNHPHASLHR